MKTLLLFALPLLAVLAQEPAPFAPPEPPAPPAAAAAPEPEPAPPLPPEPPELPKFKDFPKLAKIAPLAPFPQSGMLWQISPKAMKHSNREAEQAERTYERGSRAIGKRQWEEALNYFQEIAESGPRADAALYWKGLTLAKLGRNQEATATLDTLAKRHPQSRWAKEGKALASEIGRGAAKTDTADEEMKLFALNSIVRSDPEKGIPLAEKILERRSSPQLQERALVLLLHSDVPKAREVVNRIAKGEGSPDLQLRALRHLGTQSDKESRQVLNDVYAASASNVALRRVILHSYMTLGDRDRLLSVAKSDASAELRQEAIQLLGAMGAHSVLADLYSGESSPEIRSRILRAMFASGNAAKLVAVARTEKDPELRKQAIEQLSHMRSPEATAYLMELLQ